MAPSKIGGQMMMPIAEADVYECPNGFTVESTIFLCNQGSPTTFKLLLAKNGAATSPEQYVYFDREIQTSQTMKVTDFWLTEGDVIRGMSESGEVSINVLINNVQQLYKPGV